MTREEQAIEYIKKYRELDENLYNAVPKGTVSSIATEKCLEFWDMAISALEKQNIYDDGEHYVTISKALYDKLNVDVCEDAVSRDAVKDILNNSYSLTDAEHRLEQLPSVTRQTGEWICYNYPAHECVYCSNCKTEYYENDLYLGGSEFPNFCPNCGARMFEPQESEVRNDKI